MWPVHDPILPGQMPQGIGIPLEMAIEDLSDPIPERKRPDSMANWMTEE